MTVAFTAVSSKLIVMTVDSAITRDFESGYREYDTGRKSYSFPGVGCVTTWGALDMNKIGEFLDKQKISAISHSVNELASLVHYYLVHEYRPHELGLDDVGYHVAGYDRQACPQLYHIFWGFDRPRPPEQATREYKMYPNSPKAGEIVFLYNGRNDLEEVLIQTLIGQIRSGYITRFDFKTPIGFTLCGDLVARFACEITPEVGPPFGLHPYDWTDKVRRGWQGKALPS